MILVSLRPTAQRDLDEIWDYSADRWGLDRADDYVLEIRSNITALPTSGHRQSSRDDLYPDLRQARTGAHLIFFLIGDQTFEVVRILHERRDAAALI